MSKTAKKKAVGEYKDFLESLQLIGIGLVDSAFRIDRKRYLSDQEEELFADLNCSIARRWKTGFELRAEMSVKSSNPHSEDTSLELTASYLLHFHARNEIPGAYADQFANSEVRLVVWPYMREYVSSMCSRAHVPPIVLPLAGSGDTG